MASPPRAAEPPHRRPAQRPDRAKIAAETQTKPEPSPRTAPLAGGCARRSRRAFIARPRRPRNRGRHRAASAPASKPAPRKRTQSRDFRAMRLPCGANHRRHSEYVYPGARARSGSLRSVFENKRSSSASPRRRRQSKGPFRAEQFGTRPARASALVPTPKLVITTSKARPPANRRRRSRANFSATN